jgi:hypothetical protein
MASHLVHHVLLRHLRRHGFAADYLAAKWTDEFDALQLRMRRRRGGSGNRDLGGVSVEPNRPNDLTGGAAAELHFEE